MLKYLFSFSFSILLFLSCTLNTKSPPTTIMEWKSLEIKLKLHIPEENIYKGGNNNKIIKGRKDSFIVYDIKDNQIILPCLENYNQQPLDKKFVTIQNVTEYILKCA